MIRTVLIDGDIENINHLHKILAGNCQKIEIVGQSISLPEGIEQLQQLRPQLVFLNIDLLENHNDALLECIESNNIKVIFLSPGDQYSVNVFKQNVVDYIMDPFEIEDVVDTVNRANRLINTGEKSQWLGLVRALQKEDLSKIVLSTQEGLHYVTIDEVLYIEAGGNYSVVALNGERKYLISKSLKDFEDALTDRGFFRIHRSYLINLRHVKSFLKIDGGVVRLTDDIELMVARRNQKGLIDALSRMSI